MDKVSKPLTDFTYRKDRDRYQSICKSCKVILDRRWSLANPNNRRVSKTKCDRKLRKTKLTTKLKDGLRSRLNTAVTKYFKSNISHVRHLGCSMQELIDHLEKQFYIHPVTGTAMNWSNRGNGEGTWQIDHIKPFASAKTEEDLKEVVHYTNLRPMWWDEHLIKSNLERHTSG